MNVLLFFRVLFRMLFCGVSQLGGGGRDNDEWLASVSAASVTDDLARRVARSPLTCTGKAAPS